ncbi:hypothetical protein HPP92_012271 [Vanilla planifolia]|uniref:Protein kinase domain-containing protein n=1 Tax=Vanilla planifolia TaxID=51239 RepID=A0A835R7R1_VANPL|nr:hypothetical protein HPP92_012271 [Vanilla planifolia]
MNFPAVFFSVLFLVVSLPPIATADEPISSGDVAGLYSLRASLDIRSADWPRKTDPCSNWTGVECRSGRVVALDLTGLRRTGSGPLKPHVDVDGVRNLTALEHLTASGFFLPCPIPILFDVGVLPPSLNVLILNSASVSGDIPFSLGVISGLRVLSLSGNLLTGNIPPTLGDLTNLSSLDLSGNFFSGSIPPELSKLQNLSYLNLSSNFLSGAIPPSLGLLGMLKALVLAGNSLEGVLPAELANLLRLELLDLSSNSLVGDLPTILFSGPSNLRYVNLSNNDFSGDLPNSTWSLSELQLFDVSSNNLTGVLPDLTLVKANATGAVFNLSFNLLYGLLSPGVGEFFQRFNKVDLSNNYFLGSEPVNRRGNMAVYKLNCFSNATNQRSPDVCESFYVESNVSFAGAVVPATFPAASSSTKKSSHSSNYIFLVVLCVIGVLLATILLAFPCFKRIRNQNTKQKESPNDRCLPLSSTFLNPPRSVGESFTYEQLVLATSDFNSINLIKQGHSGDLYRGILKETVSVVVKRVDAQLVKREAYLLEMDLFAKDLNQRLVPFVGQCLEKDNEKFLVYKFMANADLSRALHRVPSSKEEKLQSLDWITRLKIATRVADALCLLHHECCPPLVHRDIQLSSILLDVNFEVHLGSLSEVCPQEGESHPNVPARLLERSQEWEPGSSGSPATCAYDIYCLGKVLLELITGKPGISSSNDAVALEWVDQTVANINIFEKDLITKIIDPTLIVNDDLMEEVWAMAVIARYCLNPRPHKRPLARHVLSALQNPLKVVREDSFSGSGPLWSASSRSSWIGAFVGSWRRNSSEIVSVTEQFRRDHGLMQAGNVRSQESSGDFSFTRIKALREIFPEPHQNSVEVDEQRKA